MGEASTAMTQTAAQTIEMRQYDLPAVPADGALVRVEAVGVCGSDVRQFLEKPRAARILGHENVGRIWAIGAVAKGQWGLNEGDLIALEEYIACHQCEWCHRGEYRHCWRTDVSNNASALRYGTTPEETEPALWGGYSQFLYMPHGAVWHRVPDNVPPEIATLFIALANGIQWTTVEGKLTSGESVLIQGPGQMGAACVIASKRVGAAPIIVTGLTADQERLEICRKLGADVTIDVEREDVRERVQEATSGRGVDLSVDATARAGAEPIHVAIDLLKRRGGRMVVQGGGRLDSFPLDRLLAHYVSLQTARGHSYHSVEAGIRLLSTEPVAVRLIHTHDFGLKDAASAVRATHGDLVDGKRALHVGILPWAST